MSEPGAATKCPAEEEGLQTMAAAVPGLGADIICSRTPANGDISDSEEAVLSLWLEGGLVVILAVEEERVPRTDSQKRVGTGDEKSRRYGSLEAKDPGEEISD